MQAPGNDVALTCEQPSGCAALSFACGYPRYQAGNCTFAELEWHFVTDEDIECGKTFAARLTSVADATQTLQMKAT